MVPKWRFFAQKTCIFQKYINFFRKTCFSFKRYLRYIKTEKKIFFDDSLVSKTPSKGRKKAFFTGILKKTKMLLHQHEINFFLQNTLRLHQVRKKKIFLRPLGSQNGDFSLKNVHLYGNFKNT